jgi:hypothetical protein
LKAGLELKCPSTMLVGGAPAAPEQIDGRRKLPAYLLIYFDIQL